MQAAVAAVDDDDMEQLQPVVQLEPAAAPIIQQQAPALESSLSPTPPMLHVLWEEWEFGIGEQK
jgi:hypothetical protein